VNKSISFKNVAVIVLASLALGLSACSSKKKSTGADGEGGGDQPPEISSSPMSFDAAGSDSGQIAGLKSVSFQYDSATLTSEAKKTIAGNVEWMKSNPTANLQVEGHCDTRGSIEYNLSLGERRANSVKNYMASLGIGSARLSVISYGKEKPLSMGDSESDHQKNRRANFLPLTQ
jgi:peptidoglycan-associated lipoprotein